MPESYKEGRLMGSAVKSKCIIIYNNIFGDLCFNQYLLRQIQNIYSRLAARSYSFIDESLKRIRAEVNVLSLIKHVCQ
jgi:hypothetical protein